MTMSGTIKSITKHVINLVYPLHCPTCGKPLEALDELGVCPSCIDAIRRNPRPYCKICGRNVENAARPCAECRATKFHFLTAYSACVYDGTIKELIHLFKFNKKISLAELLSKLMIDFIKDNDEIIRQIDVITFVPLHNRRLREREFNQSKILAFNISKAFARPFSDTLEKTALTKPQNELSREERLANLKGAFRLRKNAEIKHRAVLLVDDVMTTGATLNECSKALLDGGAKSVRCLTLARGV